MRIASIFLLFCALVPASGLFVKHSIYAWNLIYLFLLLIVVFTFIMRLIGKEMNMGPSGILIDPSRRKISLSRLQIVSWTILILSCFMTLALARFWDSYLHSESQYCISSDNGLTNCPWDVTIPSELFLLMGISLTSAVASPFINSTKASSTNSQEIGKLSMISSLENASLDSMSFESKRKEIPTYKSALLNQVVDPKEAEQITNRGALVINKEITNARLADIFKGEEVSNFKYIDIAKVQNFFFTIVAILGYSTYFISSISDSQLTVHEQISLPGLSEGLLVIIGFSHAGYLASKTFTQSNQEVESGSSTNLHVNTSNIDGPNFEYEDLN